MVLVMVLALPATASATRRLADTQYVSYYLVHNWQTFDGQNIFYARCNGDRTGPHRRVHGAWLFRRFTCRAVDDISRTFGVGITIGGPNGTDRPYVVEWACSAVDSRYSCPSGLPSL